MARKKFDVSATAYDDFLKDLQPADTVNTTDTKSTNDTTNTRDTADTKQGHRATVTYTGDNWQYVSAVARALYGLHASDYINKLIEEDKKQHAEFYKLFQKTNGVK